MDAPNGVSTAMPHRERSNTTSTNYTFARVSHKAPFVPRQGHHWREGRTLAWNPVCPGCLLPPSGLDRAVQNSAAIERHWKAHDHFPALWRKYRPFLPNYYEDVWSGSRFTSVSHRSHANCEPACLFLRIRVLKRPITIQQPRTKRSHF